MKYKFVFEIEKNDVDGKFYIFFKNYKQPFNKYEENLRYQFVKWLEREYSYIDSGFIKIYLVENFNASFYNWNLLYFKSEDVAVAAIEWLELYIILEKLTH